MLPKISVITVVFNGEDFIEDTIKSVINQKDCDLEYIVIDGASSDGTIDIIKKYEDQIDYWISESDSGIYNAMNKGIQRATGLWLNFMNAGDSFVSNTTLQDISFQKFQSVGIIYGRTIRQNSRLSFPMDIEKSLRSGFIMACHQSIFFNKSVLGKDLIYMEKYVLSDDYDLVSRIYNKGYACIEIPLAISTFGGNGKTTNRKLSTRLGRYKAIVSNFGPLALVRSLFNRAKGIKYPTTKIQNI